MSQENKIDELFRDTLGDKGMEYAPEHWEQMETLLPKQKKPATKRKLGLLALALLFLSSIVYFGLHTKTETLGNSSPVPSETANTTEPTLSNSSSKTTTTQTADIQSTPIQVESEMQGQENEVPAMVSAEKKTATSNASKQKVTQAQVIPSQNIDEEGETSPEEPIDIKPSDQPLAAVNQTNPSIQPIDNEQEQGRDIEDQNREPYSMLTVNPIHNIPFSLNYELDFNFMQSVISAANYGKKAKVVTGRRRSMYTWSVMPYMNLGMVNHRQDAAVSSWKKNTEASKNYMEYGANARFQKGRFGFVFGLALQNWTERTNYTQDEHQYTFSYSYKLIDRNYEQRADGSYVGLIKKVTDTTSHKVTTSVVCADCPVTFSYVAIPLAFHYQLSRGRFTGFAEAGMNFAFLNKVSGVYSIETMNENGQTSLRFKNADKVYFNPMVLRSNLTLGGKYRFHPFFSLNAQVNYQRSLNSMMTRYRQETDFYGFGLGLEFLIH